MCPCAAVRSVEDDERRDMIRVQSLTKHYGERVAVNGVDFTVEPGTVTGFLGPNGAGKSTTMRMIVGLDRPTAGTAEVSGRPYADLPAPLREVGVLLDARSAHRRRTAYKHLLAIAATHAIGAARVREVIGIAGLDAVADRRVGGFSLGMNQRLGIAAALLGDPQTIILDEPVNGLDPDGILWIRALLRQLAGEGKTVLLSSHLMSEMTQTADQELVRYGLRLVLEAEDDVHVVGEAADGASAVEAAIALTPDVILMDVRMPGIDGIRATQDLAARLPRTRVLVLTTYDLDEFAFGALQAGAAGFLLKNTRPAELVAAIRTVATGDAVVAPRITAKLIEVALPHLAPPNPGAREGALSALTERERDVFLQVARGLTNSEIAQTLHLSESTVKAHFGRILVKLDLPSRVQAVILAYELGIVSPGS